MGSKAPTYTSKQGHCRKTRHRRSLERAGKAGTGTGLSREEELGQDVGKFITKRFEPASSAGCGGAGCSAALGRQKGPTPICCARGPAGWVQVGCCWLLSPSQQTHALPTFALFREGCKFLGIAPLLLFLPRSLPPSAPSLLTMGSFANLIER